jgi:hypothetical protein
VPSVKLSSIVSRLVSDLENAFQSFMMVPLVGGILPMGAAHWCKKSFDEHTGGGRVEVEGVGS